MRASLLVVVAVAALCSAQSPRYFINNNHNNYRFGTSNQPRQPANRYFNNGGSSYSFPRTSGRSRYVPGGSSPNIGPQRSQTSSQQRPPVHPPAVSSNPFANAAISQGDCLLPVCKSRSNCPVPQTENVRLFDEVCMSDGTEKQYTSKLNRDKGMGVYKCSCCGNPLFSADTKFDSGTGWPSFWEPISEDAVDYKIDYLMGYPRTEVVCKKCGAHLGHVFPDGPWPTGKRYCINGVCMDFDPREHADEAHGGHAIDYASIFSAVRNAPWSDPNARKPVQVATQGVVQQVTEEVMEVGEEVVDSSVITLMKPSPQQPQPSAPVVTAMATAPRGPRRELPRPPSSQLKTMVLSGGCFWGLEMVYDHVIGVYDVVSGFAGGRPDTATYDQVTSGTTNHAESVKIVYDPKQVTFEQLLDVFFLSVHDPTTLNYQHPDSGRYYRSAAWYSNQQEKATIERLIRKYEPRFWPDSIVTEVNPLRGFYPAEDYHQDFGHRNPFHSYIQRWDVKKLDDLEKKFPELTNPDMDFQSHYTQRGGQDWSRLNQALSAGFQWGR